MDLHIEIPADEYEAMQPPGASRRPGSARRRRRGRRARASGRASGTCSGSSSPGCAGRLTQEGRTYRGVGLRYAGNASYMASAGGLKRSFLVDLERFDRPDFHGLRAIAAAERRARPDEGARGARLRPLPRGGRARAPHGAGRGDAHRPGPSTTRPISACTPSSSPWTGRS